MVFVLTSSYSWLRSFECFQLNKEKRVVDGVVGMHVDGLTDGGEGVSSERETSHTVRSVELRCLAISEREFRLSENVASSWKFGMEFVYCG